MTRTLIACACVVIVVAVAHSSNAQPRPLLGVPVSDPDGDKLATEPIDDLTLAPSPELNRFASHLPADAPFDVLVRRIQRLPYERGPARPRSVFREARVHGTGRPALDCDERAFAAARIGIAIESSRRTVTVANDHLPVLDLGIITIPALFHAVLIVRVPYVPATYVGPVLLEDDGAWLVVEMTTVKVPGDLGDAAVVLADRFAHWKIYTSRGVREGRGSLRWAPHGSAVIARARATAALGIGNRGADAEP